MEEQFTIGNAIVTDGHTLFLENGAIRVKDGKIARVVNMADIDLHDEHFIDAGGRILIPGLINPHHHLYSRFAVGISPLGTINNFTDILKNLWWPLDKVLDEETVYYSALSGVMDSVKYGVTTIFDHHASNAYVKGSLNTLKKAFEEIGIKGALSYEVSDRDGNQTFREQLEENFAFYETHKNSAQFKGMMGLHANFTLSNKSLSFIKESLPEKMPVHIHCGEGPEDFDFCKAQGYEGPVHRLEHFDLLSDSSFLIHCIHLSDKDIDILRKIKPIVVSNPESNANNKVGMMDTSRIKDYVIGTDGMSGNMIGSYRSHFLRRNGLVDQPLDKMFRKTEAILNAFFPGSGGLQTGRSADLAILDYIPETPVSLDNLFYHLILGFGGQQAYMTIADGEIIFKDGVLQKIDEIAVKQELKKAAKKLQEKFYE